MSQEIQRLKHWCVKLIPMLYDDSLSHYELMCKMLNYLNDLIDGQVLIKDVLSNNDVDIKQLKKDVKFLQDEIVKVKKGDYVSLYLDSLINWIDKNLIQLVNRIAKMVWFGLDDDGYFIAVIPDSWEGITFDTSNEGELILEY